MSGAPSQPETAIRCHLCGGLDLLFDADYPRFKRVTSDCKPWPEGGTLAACNRCHLVQTGVSGAWEDEIRRIYGGYTIYQQSGGVEQSVFAAAGGQADLRSEVIVRSLNRHHPLPEEGRLLDLGCGNGAFLRALGAARPRWRLYGSEWDDKYRATIECIPGFEHLYTGDWRGIHGTFDMISLVHVLEHVASPLPVLQMIRLKLEPGGLLAIEVPDCARNPFMLLIADHCSHFSVGALRETVAAAGFEVLHAVNSWVQKEITLVARPAVGAGAPAVPRLPEDEAGMILAGISWLKETLRRAQPLSSESSFGVFGTSIAATWLDGQLEGRSRFFVDEDPNRAGKQHLGKPILSPADVPSGSVVFVALPQPLAGQVSARIQRPGLVVVSP